MTRLTISLPDHLAAQVKTAAAGNVSGWIATVARNELLHLDSKALLIHDAVHRNPTWDLQDAQEHEYARSMEIFPDRPTR